METIEYNNSLNKLYYRCTATPEYIYQDWYGDYLTLEEVIKGSNCGLDMCDKYGLNRMLNNNTNLSGSWDHANQWIADVWMPRALNMKLKLAHIVSDDVFTALSADEWKENMDNALQLRFFPDKESALAWLLA